MNRKIIMPTDAEDAEINRGIAGDPDNPEWTEEMFASARPASEVLPEIFGAEVAAEMLAPKRGRPVSESTKEHINIRLSPDVLEFFRATGAGWQTRMDGALKEWIADHRNGRSAPP